MQIENEEINEFCLLKSKNTKSEKQINSKSINNLNKNLLSELKSIEIPINDSEKKDLIFSLKNILIQIELAINLLNKKKDYYKEIIKKIENDLNKNIEIINKKIQNNNLIENLKSNYFL